MEIEYHSHCFHDRLILNQHDIIDDARQIINA